MAEAFSSPVVMFVDDEPQMLKAINRTVRREPYKALFAAGGLQALEMLAQAPVQVIVSDLNMPEMDGLTLLKTVQAEYPQTIRMILSGITDIDPVLEAIHVGQVYRYITKPYDTHELVLAVQQALALWWMQKEKRELQEKLAEHNRLLEKRVEERTAQLLALERHAELGRYAAQLVHNLNGPIQAVTGYLKMAKMTLSQGCDNPQTIARHLDLMEKAATNLTRIVAGILGHTKNKSQFDNEWTQLNLVIENELQFFQANETFKYEVETRRHLDPDLPSVWANPLHLQQIVDNLINNALDAMEACEPKVLTLSTYAQNGCAHLTVCDSGTGIDPAILPAIFSPEFTTKPPDKGTGLGLASVKAMVESYGGRIEVYPNPPRGAKFVVILPLDKRVRP
jgi:two-component system sensor histidine kinase/response regulator